MSIIDTPGFMIDYDKENKNLFVRWGKTKDYFISEDHGRFVLDFDADHNIIGIEILYFDCSSFSHDN